MGIFFFIIFAEYGFGFWFGAQLVQNKVTNHNMGRDYNVGDVLSTFFAVVNGAFAFGSVGPAAEAIGKAKEAAF